MRTVGALRSGTQVRHRGLWSTHPQARKRLGKKTLSLGPAAEGSTVCTRTLRVHLNTSRDVEAFGRPANQTAAGRCRKDPAARPIRRGVPPKRGQGCNPTVSAQQRHRPGPCGVPWVVYSSTPSDRRPHSLGSAELARGVGVLAGGVAPRDTRQRTYNRHRAPRRGGAEARGAVSR